MRTLSQILISMALVVSFENCSNPPYGKIADKSTQDSLAIQEDDEESGPPFKEECKASFERFGEYKISNDYCNIYYCGKGWDNDLFSCKWTWGEIINNESSEDTNVKFIKIHLLDLDKFALPADGSDY